MIIRKNFTGMDVNDIPEDTEYRNCNFSRRTCIDDAGSKKGVRLFPGDNTPRTFINCNLVNCEPPPGSTCTGCNRAIIERSVILSTDTVEIDGYSITVNEYVDRIHGRYDPDSGYIYLGTPEDVPVKSWEVEE